MKTFIIALLVLLILISGMFVYSGYIKRVEQDFTKIIDEISDLVSKGQWEYAKKKSNDLNNLWEKSEKKLALL